MTGSCTTGVDTYLPQFLCPWFKLPKFQPQNLCCVLSVLWSRYYVCLLCLCHVASVASPLSPRLKRTATPLSPALKRTTTPLSPCQRTTLSTAWENHDLPCREQEISTISDFLRGTLVAGKSGCIYISGVPGTGKTACVNAVLSSMKVRIGVVLYGLQTAGSGVDCFGVIKLWNCTR